MPDEVQPIRDGRGHFVVGHGGLPGAGRPKGRSQSELVRVLIEPHRVALIDRALALTQSTDPFASANAIRICLERLAPAPKQEAEKIEVPGLADATSFADKCDAVIKAVATGEVSAEAGERVLRLLDVFRRAHETDHLAKEIAEVVAELKRMKEVNTVTAIEKDAFDIEDLI